MALGTARLRRWQRALERRGFWAVLYLRLAPGIPYTLVNYTAGLSRIGLRPFVAATALGTAPRTFAYVALGGSFGNLRRPETIIAIALLLAMGVAGLVLARRAGLAGGPSAVDAEG